MSGWVQDHLWFERERLFLLILTYPFEMVKKSQHLGFRFHLSCLKWENNSGDCSPRGIQRMTKTISWHVDARWVMTPKGRWPNCESINLMYIWWSKVVVLTTNHDCKFMSLLLRRSTILWRKETIRLINSSFGVRTYLLKKTSQIARDIF